MPTSPSQESLADRRRRQTQDEVAAAAMQLFTTVGFDETSMDDVANAAGVSRRTVYRHFETKADLVFEHPRRWLAHFTSALTTNSAGTTRERVYAAVLDVAQMIADDPDPVLEAFGVRTANPILGANHAATDAQWAELIFVNLLAEHGEARALECMVCAGSFVGATNALFFSWSLQPSNDLLAMTQATLDQCVPLWPDQ